MNAVFVMKILWSSGEFIVYGGHFLLETGNMWIPAKIVNHGHVIVRCCKQPLMRASCQVPRMQSCDWVAPHGFWNFKSRL